MTPEKRAAAIAWLNDEIRSLRLAPTINGCDMKPEWAEQYDIMQTCLEAVKVYQPVHIDRETLSCAGCDYLDRDNAPCAHCVRASGYADYYNPMSEQEKRLRG